MDFISLCKDFSIDLGNMNASSFSAFRSLLNDAVLSFTSQKDMIVFEAITMNQLKSGEDLYAYSQDGKSIWKVTAHEVEETIKKLIDKKALSMHVTVQSDTGPVRVIGATELGFNAHVMALSLASSGVHLLELLPELTGEELDYVRSNLAVQKEERGENSDDESLEQAMVKSMNIEQEEPVEVDEAGNMIH